ncbi:MAG TPA: hypothetical protein VK363_12545 [Pyrinomonadaceae bacterium]|nr:hypothetical protein [Pyrinomonadaceae bacterium]
MLFGSTVLEVAIGMIFIYLLLSLLSSAINEYIEALLNNRGKNLRRGIELLLNDQESRGEGHLDLADALYKHGLIRGLYRGPEGNKLPSYIPSRTFALALWHMVSRDQPGEGGAATLPQIRTAIDKLPNRELKEALDALIDDAQGNFDQAIKNVGDWYEAAMDRASGWYKRKVQMILLAIGFLLAAALNADSINIVKALFQDDDLRTAIVQQAENITPPPTPTPDAQPTPTPANEEEAKRQRDKAAREKQDAALERLREVRAQLNATGIPLGWGGSEDPVELRRHPPLELTWSALGRWLLKLLGLLITGFAVSQGAPFWFDLLNKFMVIRSTVKPREKSREEGSKDATDDVSEETDLRNDAGTAPKRKSKAATQPKKNEPQKNEAEPEPENNNEADTPPEENDEDDTAPEKKNEDDTSAG